MNERDCDDYPEPDTPSAGDARCNFCDGPMPCACANDLPHDYEYEDGPIAAGHGEGV